MTRDEILAMEAGRELDALVAEMMGVAIMTTKEMDNAIWGHSKSSPGNLKIVNGVMIHYGQRGNIRKRYQSFKRYSTDIAPAWEVVEKMLELGFVYRADCAIVGGPDTSIPKRTVLHEWGFRRGVRLAAHCDEAPPLAICKAALLAVMEAE